MIASMITGRKLVVSLGGVRTAAPNISTCGTAADCRCID